MCRYPKRPIGSVVRSSRALQQLVLFKIYMYSDFLLGGGGNFSPYRCILNIHSINAIFKKLMFLEL